MAMRQLTKGLPLSFRIALRELRGGIRGFRIFVICLALGVMAIAAIGNIRSAIENGLRQEGASLLGGDALIEFTYRFADEKEQSYIRSIATKVSQVVTFNSMAVVGDTSSLTSVKAVDDLYPLIGELKLTPPINAKQAFRRENNIPGAIMEPLLAQKLGLSLGDSFYLGTQEFKLTALLEHEPDNANQGYNFGLRTLVNYDDLALSGLVGPGSLYRSEYRLLLPPNTDLAALKAQTQEKLVNKGARWKDSRRPSPQLQRFVDRIGSFLILVSLAGVAVGGVGISTAIRAFIERKTSTIATLKTLGGQTNIVFSIYLLQVAIIGIIGIFIGLFIGAIIPFIIAPILKNSLPLPVSISLYPAALGEAAFYGALTALLFTLSPLARSLNIKPTALYRTGVHGVWPGIKTSIVIVTLIILLVSGAVVFSGLPQLALGSAAGISGALILLTLTGIVLQKFAARLAHNSFIRGKAALRLAIASVGTPKGDSLTVILSLGLGLSVLAAVGQIDTNLRLAIERDLPGRAPSFFFIDIQPDQLDPFMQIVNENSDVSRVESAPMLRGVLSQINGRPAREVAGDHWVVTGDRGLTYAEKPTARTKIVAGEWWPEGYTGPAQVSFAAQEAEELGIKIGDILTINVLGRDIQATLTNLREVDFSTAEIGFVMTLNPAALAGAPHSHLATVYVDNTNTEAELLRLVNKAMPNTTAIPVKDAIERISQALDALAKATAWASLATLITGFVVLIGAAAAGETARSYEASILKVLGASRGRILYSFALRSALTGAAAGGVAIMAGGLGAWSVMHFIMGMPYQFEPISAALIVIGGAATTLIAGMLFTLRSLAARPASILRTQE